MLTRVGVLVELTKVCALNFGDPFFCSFSQCSSFFLVFGGHIIRSYPWAPGLFYVRGYFTVIVINGALCYSERVASILLFTSPFFCEILYLLPSEHHMLKRHCIPTCFFRRFLQVPNDKSILMSGNCYYFNPGYTREIVLFFLPLYQHLHCL